MDGRNVCVVFPMQGRAKVEVPHLGFRIQPIWDGGRRTVAIIATLNTVVVGVTEAYCAATALPKKPVPDNLCRNTELLRTALLRTDLKRDSVILCGGNHCPTLGDAKRHRFLAIDMLARFHRFHANNRMPVVARRDLHGVHGRIVQHFAKIGDALCCRGAVEFVHIALEHIASMRRLGIVPMKGRFRNWIAHVRDANAWIIHELPHVVITHRSAADDGEIERVGGSGTPSFRLADVKGSASAADCGQCAYPDKFSSCFHDQLGSELDFQPLKERC